MRLHTSDIVRGGTASALLLGLIFIAIPASADAPPGTAYISNLSGQVTVRRGDSGDVEAAADNAPLMVGDYLSTDPSGRSEIQFDYGHVLRVAPNSQIRMEQLGGGNDSIQLAEGSVGVGVLHGTATPTQIETPSVTVQPRDPGYYRVSVRSDGTTVIKVRSGDAAVLLPQGTQELRPGSTMIVSGPASNPTVSFIGATGDDNFDRWNLNRDQAFVQSNGYNYAPNWMPGVYDLSNDGQWQNDPTYGNVWYPTDVGANWTPYSDGRWVFEPYYGWTWVDNDPWGYAPFHYGRWVYSSPRHHWGWAPGGVFLAEQAWSPALVAFVGFGGGSGLSIGLSLVENVGWVPLAPNDPFNPWWGSGVAWTPGVNVSYNVTNIRNVYRNARWPNAVRGVSREAFAAGRYQHVNAVPARYIGHAAIVRNALPVIPSREALRYSNRSVARVYQPSVQRFHAFRTAPHAPATFAQQRRQVVAYTQHARFVPQQSRPAIQARPAARPQFIQRGAPQRPQALARPAARPQFIQRGEPQRPQVQARQRPQIQARPAAPQFAPREQPRPQFQRPAVHARPEVQRPQFQARPAAPQYVPRAQPPPQMQRPAPQMQRPQPPPQMMQRAQPAPQMQRAQPPPQARRAAPQQAAPQRGERGGGGHERDR